MNRTTNLRRTVGAVALFTLAASAVQAQTYTILEGGPLPGTSKEGVALSNQAPWLNEAGVAAYIRAENRAVPVNGQSVIKPFTDLVTVTPSGSVSRKVTVGYGSSVKGIGNEAALNVTGEFVLATTLPDTRTVADPLVSAMSLHYSVGGNSAEACVSRLFTGVGTWVAGGLFELSPWAGVARPFTAMTLNDAGTIAFQTMYPTAGTTSVAQYGVYAVNPGSAPIPVATTDGTYVPATALPAPTPGERFQMVYKPRINNQGRVAFLTLRAGGRYGIYTATPGGAIQPEVQTPFTASGRTFSLINVQATSFGFNVNGDLAFQAQDGGTAILVKYSGMAPLIVATTGGGVTSVTSATINDVGDVCYLAHHSDGSDSFNLLEHTGVPGVFQPVRVIARSGQALTFTNGLTATVTNLVPASNAINGFNGSRNLAFSCTLDNGHRVMVLFQP